MSRAEMTIDKLRDEVGELETKVKELLEIGEDLMPDLNGGISSRFEEQHNKSCARFYEIRNDWMKGGS